MSYHEITVNFSPWAKAHFSLVDATPYRSPLEQNPFGLRSWVTLKQVHGCNGFEEKSEDLKHSQEGDWHYTYEKGLGLGIFVADCTAILLAGENRLGSFVAGIHAGWRGTAEKIIEKAIETLSPVAMSAWLSPSISQMNYEVDVGLIDKFSQEGVEKFVCQSRPGHVFFDLKGLQMKILKDLGAQVWVHPLCTKEQNELFSFRASKGKLSHRHLAWISM